MNFPPPHYVLFEPLNDRETRSAWEQYKKDHSDVCEFDEIDAASIFSVETFAPWFDMWISRVPNKQATRLRVLLIWHSEFLTFACQQMLRRQLEQRSFKNRVWFHVEDPTTIQPAIISRCITKRMPTFIHPAKYKQITDDSSLH
jgi:DNA polymerase III delta prime subunit